MQDPQQGHEAPAAGLALQSIWRAFLFAEACAVADVAGDILTRILAARLHLNRLSHNSFLSYDGGAGEINALRHPRWVVVWGHALPVLIAAHLTT